MNNWQLIALIGTLILGFFGFIVTILGALRTMQSSLTEQNASFKSEIKAELKNELAVLKSELKHEIATLKGEVEALRKEVRQNDKRYEERFARIATDIREIKEDIRQTFRLVLPR